MTKSAGDRETERAHGVKVPQKKSTHKRPMVTETWQTRTKKTKYPSKTHDIANW